MGVLGEEDLVSERLKLRLTALERGALESLSECLGLRPAQVASRLLSRTLSRVPLTNRELWQQLARTVAALDELEHLLCMAVPHSELVECVRTLRKDLSAYRSALLGLSPSGSPVATGEDP